MNVRKLLLITLLSLGSTAALAEDGYGRSLQMVQEFRASQAELKGKQFFARDGDKASDSKGDAQQLSAQNDRDGD
ncbi:hypothetical protein ID144_07965 [Pseudomonas sp. JM0905a]|uniref:Secreted protein n=1 Tax=Metapseudomonas resinovorans TaxID=53412 RepID=A0ABT4XYU4_METRE|nr:MULTISPECIES: hypothetical protein [Pseudomonas]MBD2836969.1 hypothetical protein [Pseudomonas sp. JM0905a]MDA8481739.1 hypothetical protein [Pseudomonas resinovorans]